MVLKIVLRAYKVLGGWREWGCWKMARMKRVIEACIGIGNIEDNRSSFAWIVSCWFWSFLYIDSNSPIPTCNTMSLKYSTLILKTIGENIRKCMTKKCQKNTIIMTPALQCTVSHLLVTPNHRMRFVYDCIFLSLEDNPIHTGLPIHRFSDPH